MHSLLLEIEALLALHLPQTHAALLPPATKAELDRFQHTVGVVVPEELRTLYGWHNGQSPGFVGSFHPIHSEMFLGLDQVAGDYEDMQSLKEYGDISVWADGWLPIFSNGNDSTCLNLEPEHQGSIISRDHETEEVYLVSSSLVAWLEDLFKVLSKGPTDEWI